MARRAKAAARAPHTATLLADAMVLVADGGSVFCDRWRMSLAEAGLFDSSTSSFLVTSSMAPARELHTATRLQIGESLITVERMARWAIRRRQCSQEPRIFGNANYFHSTRRVAIFNTY